MNVIDLRNPPAQLPPHPWNRPMRLNNLWCYDFGYGDQGLFTAGTYTETPGGPIEITAATDVNVPIQSNAPQAICFRIQRVGVAGDYSYIRQDANNRVGLVALTAKINSVVGGVATDRVTGLVAGDIVTHIWIDPAHLIYVNGMLAASFSQAYTYGTPRAGAGAMFRSTIWQRL